MEHVDMRPIGKTGLFVPPIGFGAFKIGRNQGVKYPTPYDLPDMSDVTRLLNSVLDLGCTLIDTAPAYGLSESRIGQAISQRRSEFVLSTKVGETFDNGTSHYDFSASGIKASLDRSLKNLQTDVLDIVFIHSDGRDQFILQQTDTPAILQDYRAQGKIKAIGLSGKTIAGATLAMNWADILMVEYNLNDTSHQDLIDQAASNNVAIFIKKGLASGKLPAEDSIKFVLSHPGATSLIIGGLNLDHFRENWQTALQARR